MQGLGFRIAVAALIWGAAVGLGAGPAAGQEVPPPPPELRSRTAAATAPETVPAPPPAPALRQPSVDDKPFVDIETSSVAPGPRARPVSPTDARYIAGGSVRYDDRTESIKTDLKAAPAGAAGAAGQFFAQLGAYSSAAFAAEMWTRKSTRQPEVLGAMQPLYVDKRRKSDGKRLHILRVGPFPEGDARSVCARLTDECLVVAR
ncbi:MAG: SPOR domain-containing protein [Pseudomonadota bacterium]